jgi:hypothetical protein
MSEPHYQTANAISQLVGKHPTTNYELKNPKPCGGRVYKWVCPMGNVEVLKKKIHCICRIHDTVDYTLMIFNNELHIRIRY